MKTFSLACLAGLLAAAPLRAQETAPAAPAPSPAPDSKTEADQFLQNPLVQQFLHTVVQKTLDYQKSAASGDAKLPDAKSVSSLLSNLLGDSPASDVPPPSPASASSSKSGLTAYSEARLANEAGQRRFDATTRTWVTRPLADAERNELMSRFQQDYARLSPGEQAQWETASSDGGTPPLRHWGSALGNSGGLQTGTLQTGHLATGKISNDTLPARDFVTPASTVSTTTAATAATATDANTPPADPDEAMRRWSRQIDGQFATEQDARAAAVRQYPDLRVANSAFNSAFRMRYQQYRQADPFGFLRGPGWPMKLAIFTEGDLKRQQSGTAEKP